MDPSFGLKSINRPISYSQNTSNGKLQNFKPPVNKTCVENNAKIQKIMILWRPIFIIVMYVIVLWRKFNCVKSPKVRQIKSANRWGNLGAKGGVVPPSVYT